MIIPARWSSGGIGLDEFRESMLTDNRVRSIDDYLTASDVFPGVGLKGGVCYFLWDRDNPGACRVTTIDAGGILDIAMAGTSATLLARKWESALLVNMDNDTLRRILDNPEAMAAVNRIEGWRALGDNFIETIINQSEKVKELKKQARDQDLTARQKRELSDTVVARE